VRTVLEKEVEKYEAIWSCPAYHEVSPGEGYAVIFEEFEDNKGKSIIDLGCGAGAGGTALRELGYEDVTFLDLVKVGDNAPFIQSPLWEDWGVKGIKGKRYDWGYCCDVMEHIPTEYVSLCIHRIRENCDSAFFSIGLIDDHFGKVIREPLHITIRPFVWWKELLSQFGELEDARDQVATGVYVVRF
jgi:2-polyprenyl-3-methyl-5-hydroxy-6-metoxy-1,4-benzoquinol methylase